jgi:hypothetical protein
MIQNGDSMKLAIHLMLCLSLPLWAQNIRTLDIRQLCEGKEESSSNKTSVKIEKTSILIDKGFCAEFLKLELKNEIVKTTSLLDKSAPLIECNDKSVSQNDDKDKWKLRFYASHSFTTYFNTDLKIDSSRYKIEIKDYEWAERGSRDFFNPNTWKEPGNHPFQWIDEPSNTFTLSLEKDGHEFFLSAFHPKFLQAKNQVKHISGTIDGVAVNEVAPINRPFDGYNQDPGESEIVRNQNTHKQMSFELGYGHRFKLFDGKLGSIDYVPSLGLGVMTGANYTVVIKENDWWGFEDNLDNFGVQGLGGSLTNRIEFNLKKESVGIFYENKLSYYQQKHGFLDGTQEYNLGYMGNSVGFKFMILNPKNQKRASSGL